MGIHVENKRIYPLKMRKKLHFCGSRRGCFFCKFLLKYERKNARFLPFFRFAKKFEKAVDKKGVVYYNKLCGIMRCRDENEYQAVI